MGLRSGARGPRLLPIVMHPLSPLVERHDEFVRWRHQIHAHPELAYQERDTARFVAEKLSSWGIEVHQGLATTGVVGRLSAGASERRIGLRADMDALPMQEKNQFLHRSKNDGCFHGCGHDGHTTMLLAAAWHLSQTRNFDGTVHFIFQPAEETAGGGRVMVEQGLFELFPCDEVYALHNWPTLPKGQIAVRGGPVMAATDQWDLEVIGRGGHAAFPHTTVDPIYVGTQIVQAFQGLLSREMTPTDAAVISTTRFVAGSAYNVIPDKAILAGTVRTFDLALQDTLDRRMGEVARSVAAAWRAEAVFTFNRGYPATHNDAECARYAAEAAAKVVGEASVITEYEPSMGGEDFAYMLQACPGAYLWLGQRDDSHPAQLHSPHYDFNDSVLTQGASLYVALAESRLLSSGGG